MQLIINQENVELLPIKHFSVSGLLEYMKNEQSFFKKYIRLEFDNKTWPALMIWKAFHAWLDYYYSSLMNGEAQNMTVSEFAKRNLFEEIRANENLGLSEIAAEKLTKKQQEDWAKLQPKDIKEFLAPGEDEKTIAEKTEFEKFLLIHNDIESRELELLKSFGLTDEEIQEAKTRYIDWGKTQNPLTAIIDVETVVKNYFDNIPNYKEVLYSEVKETVEICDLDGEVLPLPLKWALDLIVRDDQGKICIVDHKWVWSFADLTKWKASYELQAGAYFFIAWAITWERPTKMIFDETLKGDAKVVCKEDPTRKLLQADLKELADVNGIEYEKYVKNAELIEMLLTAGVLEYTKTLKPIIIDYDETPEIITAFLEIYKIVLNRLWIMAIMDVPFEFLPNPFSDFSWEESWLDFKEGLDTSRSWKDLMQEKNESGIKEEINEIEL